MRRFASIVAGLAVGIAFWYFVTPPYAAAPKALAATAAPLILGRGYTVGGGTDPIIYKPDGSIGAKAFMSFITANFVTLFALFAASAVPLSGRNVTALLAAIACMIPVHAAGILVIAKAFLAPPGSLWGNVVQAYVVFFSHASAFAMWWLFRPGESVAKPARKRKRSRK